MSTSKGQLKHPKKAYHHGDLREVLITAAVKIIREEGEDALSMRKLATNTGVSRTAPYHHFGDKQDLLCAIAEEGFKRFDLLFRQRESTDDLHGHMQRQLRVYVNFAIDNSEYYDLMFSSRIWKSSKISESLKENAYSSFRGYTETVTTLCENIELPDGVTPLRIAQLSWSTFHGMSRLVIDGIYVDKTAIDAMLDTATKLLIPRYSN
jgi:AcrR family transcriptional regulator